MNKAVSEAYPLLSNTCCDDAISKRICCEWFHCFNNGGSNDKDRHSDGQRKVSEDTKLKALHNEDSRDKVKKNYHNPCE